MLLNEKIVDPAIQKLRKLGQNRNIGTVSSVFPFAHRLRRNAQQFAETALAEVILFSEFFDLFGNAYRH